MGQIETNREFMKSVFASLDAGVSDQSKGLPQPLVQQPYDKDAQTVSLPQPDKAVLANDDLYACIQKRRSQRQWTRASLSIEELSFLLWATQGVQEVLDDGYATLRTVPSAGARHAFETYLAVNRVEGIDQGLYRYLALSHELLPHYGVNERRVRVLDRRISTPNRREAKSDEYSGGRDRRVGPPDRRAVSEDRRIGPDAPPSDPERAREQLLRATFGQRFVANAAVVFIWSCVPYRAEWRYSIAAHKNMLLDAGHLCQNLYLACEAIGAGTCAVAAYDQDALDAFLKLDGQEEYAIYLAPVGKIGR